MNSGFDITEPFEQILKRLAELKKNPELFSEIANLFEQIKQIEKFASVAINTLQNYYQQFTKQVDILSSLIDFQATLNYGESHQEIVNLIFSFLKENTPFQDAFLFLKLNETDHQFEIVTDEENKRDQYQKFLTNDNIEQISEILRGRDLGILISDVKEDVDKKIDWNLIGARSIILFPIRMRGKLFGFGILSHKKNVFQFNHLLFVNLVSGFISQTVFHYFYFSHLKSKLITPFQPERDIENQGYSKYHEKGPLFIFTLDSDGVIVDNDTHASKQFEKYEYLIGKKFLDLVQKDYRKPLQNILNQIQEGDIRFYRAPIILDNHNEYILELYITKIEHQNDLVMTIISGADITLDYHRNVQNSRNEILDEITRFSEIVNAYLENPLKELTLNLNIFSESIDKDEPIKIKFQMLERSVEQISRLVESLSKFGVSQDELRIETNINDIITNVFNEIKEELPKNIAAKYFLDSGISSMLTYPGKIKKLLKILLQNSIEAITDKGNIRVVTQLINVEKDGLLKPNLFFLQKGKYVEISFEDDGMGIDSRVLPQIFKPFFSTKIRNDGIGLGLFVAYNIVKDLEGDIFVESKQNEFTKFYIYIPYKGDLEMREILPGMAEAIKEKSPTILVVDDEFNIRSMLKEVFEMNGYSVYTAANGQEALDIFKKHANQIDLIILDMVMPVMDGKRAFYEIKKVKKNQKVIIISGYAKKEDLREILNEGASAFMSKPFQIESIVEKVSQYLSSTEKGSN